MSDVFQNQMICWVGLVLGHLVKSEILMASESGCPIEIHKIDIEKCDETFDAECRGGKYMPFHRAWYDHNTGQSPNNPREQVKESSTSFCQNDGCIIPFYLLALW